MLEADMAQHPDCLDANARIVISRSLTQERDEQERVGRAKAQNSRLTRLGIRVTDGP
jgi:hypothetical protein